MQDTGEFDTYRNIDVTKNVCTIICWSYLWRVRRNSHNSMCVWEYIYI